MLQILTNQVKQRVDTYEYNGEKCFLAQHPNTETVPDPNSTEENPLPEIPKWTNAEWLDVCTRRWLKRQLELGYNVLKKQSEQSLIVDLQNE